MRSIRLLTLVAVLGVPLAGCGAIELRPEQKDSYQLGFRAVASNPGKNWQCQSLAVRGDLLAIMLGQEIILYRKREGLIFYGSIGRKGVTPKQSQAWANDPDACAKWNHAKWTVNPNEGYSAFNHPSLIELFDNAQSDPQKFFEHIASTRLPYFGYYSRAMDGQLTVSKSPQGPSSSYFYQVADEMQALRAKDVFPYIESTRNSLSPQGVAQVKAARAAELQDGARKRSEAAAAVRGRFEQAANQPKDVGMTVCSQDNRIAQVEQLAGPRIKLSLRGRAMATYGEFGEIGPHKLALARSASEVKGPRLVQDDYFLFNRLSRSIQISNESGTYWDESQYWGVCDYR